MPTNNDARLHFPPLPPRHVPRRRLTAALDRARGVPLVLIAAGPGAGKTVLLTEWVMSQSEPVVWFAPGPDDNEPRRFWRRLRSVVQASGALAEGALAPRIPDDTASESFDALFSDLKRPQTPFVLIIDDAHMLTHPGIVEGLDSLIRTRPPQAAPVSCRAQRSIAAATPLSARRTDARIARAELALTRREGRALLPAHGITLPRRP